MLALYWIVRVYVWVIVGWVLMSWIPIGGVNELRSLLGIVVEPVVAPFRFLSLGPLSLAPLIPLLILTYAENWLGRQAGAISVSDDSEPAAQNPDGTVNAVDLQPAVADDTQQRGL